MLECVINISEGRDLAVLDELAAAAGASLRDRHSDAFHHRSVFTMINEPAALVRDVHSLIGAAYRCLDLTDHRGVHPRFGVVDVVPFVALDPRSADDALALRDQTARWIADTFAVPVFLYGPLDDGVARTLPEVRRGAFRTLQPDMGPGEPSPTRGAAAVGARPILVAWNLWLAHVSLERARTIAAALRQPAVRTLAFVVGDEVQVSCNIIDTDAVRLSHLYGQVLDMVGDGAIHRCELVGLAPASLLEREPRERWDELGLSASSTIEARCAA